MTAQVAPGIARWELKYVIPNNFIENVFHVQAASLGLWTETEMDAVKAAFQSWFASTMSPLLSDALSLYEIIGTDLTSLHGIRKAYGVDPPLDGNLNAEYLPANVTFALKADIGVRGRGTAGRIFWPAIVNTQVVNNNLDLSVANTMISAMGNLIAVMAAVPGIDGLCVPHFTVATVKPPSVAADLIDRYLYSDLWLDSQRDRLPEHKKHKRRGIR